MQDLRRLTADCRWKKYIIIAETEKYGLLTLFDVVISRKKCIYSRFRRCRLRSSSSGRTVGRSHTLWDGSKTAEGEIESATMKRVQRTPSKNHDFSLKRWYIFHFEH